MNNYRKVIEELRAFIESKPKTRMFGVVKEPTYNYGKGCSYLCSYCNVVNELIPKLQRNPKTERYRDGVAVKLFEDRLEKPNYRKEGSGLVFLWYMGDMWCPLVPDEWIRRGLEVVESDPSNEFLTCTKNPKRYFDFLNEFPENLWLGTTIETNQPIANRYTDAPSVEERYRAMKEIEWAKKLLSIEPKMVCNPSILSSWAEDMGIKIAEVGADNYGNDLPEPYSRNANLLLEYLDETCDLVVRKKGLERLL